MLQRLIRLREAKRAARNGNFREALECLDAPNVRDHRDAKNLRDRLVRQILEAVDAAIDQRNFAAALHLLETARERDCDTAGVAEREARLERARRHAATEAVERDHVAAAIRNRAAAGSIVGAQRDLERATPAVAAQVDGWIRAQADQLEGMISRIEAAADRNDVDRAQRLLREALSAYPANDALDDLQRRVHERWRDDLLNRIQSPSEELSLADRWRAIQDALRVDPGLHESAAMRPAMAEIRGELVQTVREATQRGTPESVGDLINPLRESGDRAADRLAEGVACWLRARELQAAAELERALPLLGRAATTLPDSNAIAAELEALRRDAESRSAALAALTTSLESGDQRTALERLDAIRGSGVAPDWADALRAELASHLDAGAAAIVEARRLMNEGHLEQARAALLPLLSGPDTREAASAIWRDVDQRAGQAAELLGQAEAVLFELNGDRTHLATAERQLAEARGVHGDHPGLHAVESAVTARRACLDAIDEAQRLLAANALEGARNACNEGLRHAPDNACLRRLHRQSTARLAVDLIERAERRFDVGEPTAAHALLDRATDLAESNAELARRIAALRRRNLGAPSVPTAPARPTSAPDQPHHLIVRVEEGPEALILTDDVISIGNAREPSNHIAIMANISSRHATIRRETSFHGGVAYRLVAAPDRPCVVSGEPAVDRELRHGDEIQLGGDVTMVFRLPDPGSSSPVLEITRGYHVDDIRYVVLMKGPGLDGRIRIGSAERVHLPTPRSAGLAELVLEETGDHGPELTVRSETGVEVDGHFHRQSASVSSGRFVQCGECRFHLGRLSR